MNNELGVAMRVDSLRPVCFACLVAMVSACGSGAQNGSGDSPDGSTAGSSGNSSGSGSGNTSSDGSGNSSGGSDSGSNSGSGVTSTDGGSLTYYVSPTGAGMACTRSAPCSITGAQTVVRAAVQAMQGDITVELADGVYTLTAPLMFNAADSPATGGTRPAVDGGTPSGDAGAGGPTVVWQAAVSAHPVLSGAMKVTGWTQSDSGRNIWKASAPSTFASRQLYVDGKLATRARSGTQISRNDMNMQTNGWSFTNSSLSFLNNLKQPARAELNVIG